MMHKNNLRALALASTCLLPLAATAQTADLDNEVDIGGQYQSNKSALFGRYNGDWQNGPRLTGGFTVKGGDAWDSGGTYYYNAYGKNLDLNENHLLPESVLGFKAGEQGKWGIGFNYDAISYFQSDTFHSAWAAGGDGALNSGLTAGAYHSWQANLVPLTNEDIGTRRDRFTGTGKYNLGNGFEVSGTLYHEHKEGTMEQSMSIGATTNNFYTPNGTATSGPHSLYTTAQGASAASTATTALGVLAYFPQPIDYDTDRYDAKLKYTGGDLQTELTYSFSKFTNNYLSFNAANPFTVGGPGSTGAQLLALQPTQAAFALPPDNYQHSVTADVGYDLNRTTTVSGTVQYAWQIADNTLPAESYALNPNLNPTAAQRLLINNPVGGTSDSWNPMAKVLNGNLTLISRPITDFDIKAAYNINTYENTTSRTAMYGSASALENSTTVPTTTAAQLAATNCSGAASVDSCTVPWAWTKQKIGLDLGYKILPSTRVTVGYAFSDVDRKYMMNDQSHEDTYTAKVNTRFSNAVFGAVTLEHSDRTGKAEVVSGVNAPLEISSYYLGNGGAMWYDSSRVSDTVKGNLMYAVNRDLNLGLNGQYVVDRYPDIYAEGMNWDNRASVGPQVSYEPMAGVRTMLFYNYEQMRYNSHSIYGSLCKTTATGATSSTTPSAANPTAACAVGTTTLESNTGWNQTNTNGTHTVGANVEWQVIPDVFKIFASYNLSYGKISWDYTDNITAAALSSMNAYNQYQWAYQPIPNVTSILNSFKLQGEYTFTPAMSMVLGYNFERYMSSDYNNDVQTAAFGSALMSGDGNPAYNIHVITASVRVKF
jgi:MtrB/PioB family decaheme-associated outer membrane protein